jgi:hypothetical protein
MTQITPIVEVNATEEMSTPSSVQPNDSEQIDKAYLSMSSQVSFVATHILRIESATTKAQIQDSLWRIASCIDLFAYGASNGTLTPNQITKIYAYIERFGESPAGKKAIDFHRSVAS